MARWLALATAARLNIWANCECPFPNAFIRNIYRLIVPEISEQSLFDKKFMVWQLMDIIPSLLSLPHFEKVRHYLASDDGLKLYQLAHELSDLFDQYTIFRPEMILDWEANGETYSDARKWQSVLWQHLANRLEKNGNKLHRAALLHYFEEKITSPQFDRTLLPPRISIFGISSLPPYYLRVLAGLAHHIDLHIFVMNPCMEYWFDIIADRDIVKVGRTSTTSRDLLHLEHGNTLLASMGHLGRDFLALLQELDGQEEELFQDPGDDTLLACIQQDILFLRENQNAVSFTPPAGKMIKPDDDSIVFQSCHSPMREVEILHDQLLDIFEQHAGCNRITPRDILVMAPDINEYAPLIRAVFDAEDPKKKKLPYSIADQAISGSSRYIKAFRTILSVAVSRFTSIDIVGLLKSEAVRRKFSIGEHEIPLLEKWLDQTAICWGIDEKHKRDLSLPDFSENTWRAGLDRLLLGYAMKGNNKILFANILPYDHMEGSGTDLLGRFLDFAEQLFEIQETLRSAHSLSKWSELFLQITDTFLLPDDSSEADSRLLYQAIWELQEHQKRTSYNAALPVNVVEAYLSDSLEQRYASMVGGTDFLTGSVTFCSMLPMRSIPFKVICLLGMDDGAYPRPGRRRSFDLMAHEPMRGDRSRRHDDRYLFLETILSARKKLSISFVGQSVQDTGQKPPSVLVSELMDYIKQRYNLEGRRGYSADLVKHLTTLHRLQPFHPHYFSIKAEGDTNDLFSYSTENCAAAASLGTVKKKTAPPVKPPLPVVPDGDKELSLHELSRFFSQPVRYFLHNRVGIGPIEEIRDHKTSEPFDVKGLARYELENDILARLMSDNDWRDLYLIKKAAGGLPHGKMGEVFFSRTLSEVQSFKSMLDRKFFQNGHRQLAVTLSINDKRISGRLDCFTDTGLVQYRYTKIKAKDIIRGWINHLVLNRVFTDSEADSADITYLVGTDGIYRFEPVTDSLKHLTQLLNLYQQGLTQPLHFFPESSFVYARAIHQGKDRQAALIRAKNKWDPNVFAGRAEKNDPYNRLCLKDLDLAESDFSLLAEMIILPILRHMKRQSRD
jgi:exodeoxyribonuclease V gamma subunit